VITWVAHPRPLASSPFRCCHSSEVVVRATVVGVPLQILLLDQRLWVSRFRRASSVCGMGRASKISNVSTVSRFSMVSRGVYACLLVSMGLEIVRLVGLVGLVGLVDVCLPRFSS
jgi:hypothetical protein